MQPTTRRHRVKPAASAAVAVGQGVPASVTPTPAVGGLPCLKFTMANGLLEIQDAVLVQQLLENEQRQRLAAEAEQAALAVVYRLSTVADESQPHGGLLTRRLGVSLRTCHALLTDGRLRYTCLGEGKAYRVTELACRQLLGDAPPT